MWKKQRRDYRLIISIIMVIAFVLDLILYIVSKEPMFAILGFIISIVSYLI